MFYTSIYYRTCHNKQGRDDSLCPRHAALVVLKDQVQDRVSEKTFSSIQVLILAVWALIDLSIY